LKIWAGIAKLTVILNGCSSFRPPKDFRMKKLLLIVLAFVCCSVHAQNWGKEFGSNYTYVRPTGSMGHIIQRGHGADFNYGWLTPDKRFALGLDLSFAMYGRDKSRQEYTLDDGSVVPMDIIVSNSFTNFMVYGRWYPRTHGLLLPYVTGKLGYSRFSTDLNIYDPDDFDHCEPVDSEVLYNDGTMIATVGAGVKLDFASIFKKMPSGKFHFESGVNMTQGGTVRYMNEDAAAHQHSTTPVADNVMARFRNTQTQLVHEHHVGYLYSSPVQMINLRFGLSMRM
jgi:opacity protein-like surface antigen